MTPEELHEAQKNYDDYLFNVIGKCSHDRDIVFAMMGDMTSLNEHTYVLKCTKCNGHVWELKNGRFFKEIVTPNSKYRCRWEEVTPRDDPRLLKFVNYTTRDVLRGLYLDIARQSQAEELK